VVVVVSLVLASAALLTRSVANARPAQHRTIAQVSALLDKLSRRNDMLDERYNAAVAAVAKQRTLAHRAEQRARAAAAASVAADNRLKEAAAARYEAGAIDPTGMLLTSQNPQAYLDNLSAMDYLSRQFATLASRASAAETRSRAAAHQAGAALAKVQARARAMDSQRDTLVARTAHFKKVLAALTAEQRRRYAQARAVAQAKAEAIARAAQAQTQARTQSHPRRTGAPANPPVAPPTTSSAAVQKVIAFAEAQVGKAYTYAGTGPSAYDCSGLTMMSWAQAGMHLPHQASAQYNVGRHISYDQLQPGDLIFLYQPIGHVEIYVGNDLAVSAADPALGVVYVHPSRDMADYVGATRPQG
jgi:cell wall-associated NlpC family hydrolase